MSIVDRPRPSGHDFVQNVNLQNPPQFEQAIRDYPDIKDQHAGLTTTSVSQKDKRHWINSLEGFSGNEQDPDVVQGPLAPSYDEVTRLSTMEWLGRIATSKSSDHKELSKAVNVLRNDGSNSVLADIRVRFASDRSRVALASPGTCQWLFDDSGPYTCWLTSPQQRVLLLTGGAGMGKSVLTRLIADTLDDDDNSNHKAFAIFCDLSGAAGNTYDTILASFLLWWLDQIDSSDIHLAWKQPSSSLEVSASLLLLFAELSRTLNCNKVVLIVDGLDALSVDDCDQFETLLLTTTECRGPRILISSREISQTRTLSRRPWIVSVALDAAKVGLDVATYIDNELQRHHLASLPQTEALSNIKLSLASRVEGVFQVLKMQLRRFEDDHTGLAKLDQLQYLEQLLVELSPFMAEYYRARWSKLMQRDDHQQNLSDCVFSVILALGGRPVLRQIEYIVALSGADPQSIYDTIPRSDQAAKAFVQVCCGDFVDVVQDAEGDHFAVMHDSIKQFLTQPESSLDAHGMMKPRVERSRGHAIIARAIMTFLVLDQEGRMTARMTDLEDYNAFRTWCLYTLPGHVRHSGVLTLDFSDLLAFCFSPAQPIVEQMAITKIYVEADRRWRYRLDKAPASELNPLKIILREDLSNVLALCQADVQPAVIHIASTSLVINTLGPGNEASTLEYALYISDDATISQLLRLGLEIEQGPEATLGLLVGLHQGTKIRGVQRSTACLDDLIEHGLDIGVTLPDSLNVAAMLYACNSALARHFVTKGYKILPSGEDETSVLVAAVQNNDYEFVEWLQGQCTPDIWSSLLHASSSGGLLPIHYAAESTLQIFEFLSRQYTLPLPMTANGPSVMHIAITYGQVEIFKHLAQIAIDIDHTSQGLTVLLIAAASLQVSCIELLLKLKANPNARTPDNESVFELIMASSATNALLDDVERAILSLISQPSFEIEQKDSVGYTPLLDACYRKYINVALVLLARGADTTAQSDSSATPLHWAVNAGSVHLVNAILRQRRAEAQPGPVSVDDRRNDGWTPLMVAASNANIEIAKILLQAGADVTCMTAAGHDYFSLCCIHIEDQAFLCQTLREKLDRTNIHRGHGSDALPLIHLAASHGLAEVVRTLLDLGADPMLLDQQDMTALYLAARNGHNDCARLLLQESGCPTNRTKDARTHLDAIALYCDPETLSIALPLAKLSHQRLPLNLLAAQALSQGKDKQFEILLELIQKDGLMWQDSGFSLLQAAVEIDSEAHFIDFLAQLDRLEDDKLRQDILLMALPRACDQRRTTMASALIHRIQDPHICDKESLSSTLITACSEDSQIARQLLAGRCPPLSQRNMMQETILHAVASNPDSELLKDILSLPRTSSMLDDKAGFLCHTALHRAICARRFEDCKTLLDAGADPSIRDIFGKSAFDHALVTDALFSHVTNLAKAEQLNDWKRQKTLETKSDRQAQCRKALTLLLRWLHEWIQNKVMPFSDLTARNGLLALGQALRYDNQHEDADVAMEVAVFGPPSKMINFSSTCDTCFTRKYETMHFCQTTRDRSNACFGHEFSALPRKEWFELPSDHVDTGVTPEGWTSKLMTRYDTGDKAHPDVPSVIFEGIQFEGEALYQGMHDLLLQDCRTTEIMDFLDKAPRAVWSRSESGHGIVETAITCSKNDETAKAWLQALQRYGASMLAETASGLTTAQAAIERGFQSSLYTILDERSFDFDRANKMGPSMLDKIIKLRDYTAARLCLTKHHFWVVQGHFHWIDEVLDFGVDIEEIILILFDTVGMTGDKGPADETHSDHMDPDNASDLTDADELLDSTQEQDQLAADHSWPEIQPLLAHGDSEIQSSVSGSDSQELPQGSDWLAEEDSLAPFHPTSASARRVPDLLKHIQYCCHSAWPQSAAESSPDLSEALNQQDTDRPTMEETTDVVYRGQHRARMSQIELYARWTAFTAASTVDNKLIIRLNSRDTQHDTLAQLVSASEHLVELLAAAQSLGSCCERLFILRSGSRAGKGVVECSDVPFAAIVQFHDLLTAARESADQTHELLLDCAEIAAPYMQHFCGDLKRTENAYEIQDRCALAIQIWSLALLLSTSEYRRSALRKLYDAHMVTNKSVHSLILQPLHEGPPVYLHAHAMTCTGHMLGEELIAFSRTSRTDPSSSQSDLLASCEQVAQLFGTGMFCFSDRVNHRLRALGTSGGFIYVLGSDTDGIKQAHWLPSLSYLDVRTSDTQEFSLQDRLLISACRCCNLSEHDWQALYRRANATKLVDLLGRSASNVPASRATTLGIGFTPPFTNFTFQRTWTTTSDPGNRRKDRILERWLSGEAEVLNEPWGLQVNVFSGLTRRVPIRTVLSDVIVFYVNNGLPDEAEIFPSAEWEDLVRRLISRLRGTHPRQAEHDDSDFVDFMAQLSLRSPRHFRYVRNVVTGMLRTLNSTGVVDRGPNQTPIYFKALWTTSRRGLYRAYRFKLESAPWVHALVDGSDSATYAVVSMHCFRRSRFPGALIQMHPPPSVDSDPGQLSLSPFAGLKTRVTRFDPDEQSLQALKVVGHGQHILVLGQEEDAQLMLCSLERLDRYRFMVIIPLPITLMRGSTALRRMLWGRLNRIRESGLLYEDSHYARSVIVCDQRTLQALRRRPISLRVHSP